MVAEEKQKSNKQYVIEKLAHGLRDEDLEKFNSQFQPVQDECDDYFFQQWTDDERIVGLHIKDIVAGVKICKEAKQL